MENIFSPGAGGLFPMNGQIREIFARGTLIRMAFLVRLERTSRDPVPATAFELPGPELNGEEAEARLGPAW